MSHLPTIERPYLQSKLQHYRGSHKAPISTKHCVAKTIPVLKALSTSNFTSGKCRNVAGRLLHHTSNLLANLPQICSHRLFASLFCDLCAHVQLCPAKVHLQETLGAQSLHDCGKSHLGRSSVQAAITGLLLRNFKFQDPETLSFSTYLYCGNLN